MGHQFARMSMVEAVADAEETNSSPMRHLTRPASAATAADIEPAPHPTDLSAMIAAAQRMIAAR